MQKGVSASKMDRGLMLMDLLACILILTVIFLPELKAIRIALGTPFLLLFPGYSAVSALYPEKKDLDGAERLIYGLGLSLAFIPPLGIFLNWSPYGLNLTTTLISLFSLMILFTAISWLRRRKVSPEGRFRVTLSLSDLRKWWKEETKMAVVCVAILILVVGEGSYLVTHQHGNEFTEFYLGEGNNLETSVNSVELGITNHEGVVQTYSVEAVMDNRELGWVDGIELGPGESWKDNVNFRIEQGMENETVRFVLYMDSERTEKELRLHLGGN
ncbi:hypothetical protein AKJ57_00475 [candidate division MSBL1 archaeon SCGC-AAA259A05]|uniref:DUF1616 domain-containing protein n=1 Tax=candidate division MSBL1 archaeon SCGC-AAA259A05 TaxID=1698259 RepID=A0A133UBU9_9EURY|nr:hypothetical protein AKJ57_00475 [candidate division MSBL1 archaeon SCGC-AAA259A05]